MIRIVGIGILLALGLSLIFDIPNGLGGSEVFTGIALALAIGAMIYLKNMQNVFTEDIDRRVKAEFDPETRAEVYKVYQHLKAKEMEGLFPIILDKAHGSLSKVRELANIAEGVGWKAFLESQW